MTLHVLYNPVHPDTLVTDEKTGKPVTTDKLPADTPPGHYWLQVTDEGDGRGDFSHIVAGIHKRGELEIV